MSPPWMYVRGATLAVTRRTTMRKAFLAPWHPLVEACWLYALADAQAHTGVALHSAVPVVTHQHLSVTGEAHAYSEFFRRVHTDLSKALNHLLALERYDAPRELFDDRPPHRMRLLDAAAQVSHHVYEQLNVISAGLVDRVERYPMTVLGYRHYRAGGLAVERPPILFDPRNRPAERFLRVTPSPEAFRAFDGDMDALVHHLDRLVEHGRRRIRDARGGRPVVGAKKLRRLHPWSEPRTLRESGGRRNPTFKVGARGLAEVHLESTAAREVTRFRREHRETRLARRDGDVTRRYPFGTYAARVYYGAPVEPEPARDAVLAKPGPLLDDVVEQLRSEHASPEQRHAVVDEVRDAFDAEAAELVAQEEVDLLDRNATTSVADDAGAPRAAVVVKHRFDSRPGPGARRIVTLRDRRRGRRRKSAVPGTSDPPG